MDMELIDCVTPLLIDEQGSHCINHAHQEEAEDASSGYESNDNLDKDFVSSQGDQDNQDSRTNFVAFKKQPEEVMNFQNTSSLSYTLRLITEMPEMCDVTFVIGPTKVHVYGVRAILAARSLVFHQLILKHLPLPDENDNLKKSKKRDDKLKYGLYRSTTTGVCVQIPVRKYDPDVFRKLVEFAHCGNINIDEEIVVGLYCGASQFRFNDLMSACLDFMDRCLEHGRVKSLMTSLQAYSTHKSSQVLFEMINRKANSVKDRRETEC